MRALLHMPVQRTISVPLEASAPGREGGGINWGFGVCSSPEGCGRGGALWGGRGGGGINFSSSRLGTVERSATVDSPADSDDESNQFNVFSMNFLGA